MPSLQPKVCFFYWNQSKSKLKKNINKVNQNKQPNQFIYVQDNSRNKNKEKQNLRTKPLTG